MNEHLQYPVNEQRPGRMSDAEMTKQIAAAVRPDDVSECWMQDWCTEFGVEVRPAPMRMVEGRMCWDFDVVLITGVPRFNRERVQARLRVEIYDDGTPLGCVETGLRVYATHDL